MTTEPDTYEVMLYARIATRFKVRERWVIAASFQDEAAARQEFARLAQEFPGETTVSLMLIASKPDPVDGQYRERTLLVRGRDAPKLPPKHQPAPAAPRTSKPARPLAERARAQARPLPESGRSLPLVWWLACGLMALAAALSLLLHG